MDVKNETKSCFILQCLIPYFMHWLSSVVCIIIGWR